MGSFDETCALSNLNISPGTPVRVVFLTQNPYVESDGHEVHRGVYHHDNWFLRTLPFRGEYADYGEVKFEPGPVTKVIEQCFDQDVVERPFGFNRYHTHDVTKGKGINHYLKAAWQGRLLVKDQGDRPQPIPEAFPTWEKVYALLRKAKLPIKHEENENGFTAQPVVPGLVAVSWDTFQGSRKQLEKAAKLLGKHYDTSLKQMFDDRDDYDMCLLVTVKDGLANPALLLDPNTERRLTTHPKRDRDFRQRQLPVLAVMIREDAWQVYATATYKNRYDGPIPTVEALKKRLAKSFKEMKGILPAEIATWNEMHLRDTMFSIPFQVTAGTHVAMALKSGTDEEELLQVSAETSRVEIVLGRTHQPWYIPPLGGQDGAWGLQVAIRKQLLDIAKSEDRAEKAAYEEG